jgi:hypothetical protein
MPRSKLGEVFIQLFAEALGVKNASLQHSERGA